jgi:hypothetical protein
MYFDLTFSFVNPIGPFLANRKKEHNSTFVIWCMSSETDQSVEFIQNTSQIIAPDPFIVPEDHSHVHLENGSTSSDIQQDSIKQVIAFVFYLQEQQMDPEIKIEVKKEKLPIVKKEIPLPEKKVRTIEQSLREQVEFYFSPSNAPHDRFLWEMIQKDPEGCNSPFIYLS